MLKHVTIPDPKHIGPAPTATDGAGTTNRQSCHPSYPSGHGTEASSSPSCNCHNLFVAAVKTVEADIAASQQAVGIVFSKGQLSTLEANIRIMSSSCCTAYLLAPQNPCLLP